MPMINCDEVMRQLWDYLDGELTPERMQAIEAHLAMCGRCHPHAEFERAFLRAVAQVRREPVDTDGLAAKVRSVLQAEGFQPT
ncbi:MAG: zf-HC2 domain-containing protein [Gemmatimonadetes bacterium]|jgi:anti-sigma factor (TIGR02949 family)|nr:zf-HC2 domain-containing protein [Gemmatimonadota bacterium]MBK6842904.1 zf-HC2 domain-containing protein [Gemmatimonadota bacterium]MBK9976425.1 zf-HC2 domain-containing protein [Gemmatimonadota bacterium]